MGTGQILQEVFEKRVNEQIELIEKLSEDNFDIDTHLIRDALNKITEYYYKDSKIKNVLRILKEDQRHTGSVDKKMTIQNCIGLIKNEFEIQ